MRGTIKANAQAFAVRRVGEMHDWCISQAEIGALTGLSVWMVNNIMTERGYRVDSDFIARRRSSNARRQHMSYGYDVDVNEMELTDIFS